MPEPTPSLRTRAGTDVQISVIIPTYNRESTLRSTLESLTLQNYPPELFEVIVVDNASSDGTGELVRQFCAENPDHQIRYVYESRPGVHYARNHAGKAASYDLLYFTDDDIVASPEMLSEIIKPFLFDSRVACVTGRVLPSWQSPPPAWVRKHCYNSLLSILDIPEDFVIAPHLDYIYSCHMAIRKHVLFESGGFNPENTKGNWVGDGETGLVIKIEKLGYRFGFNGAAVVHHLIPASRMTQAYLMKRMENSGNSYAFTYYRRDRPSPFGLLGEIFILLFFKLAVRIAEYTAKSIIYRDVNFLRFIPAYCMYYFRRSQFNFRLALDEKLRAFALRDHWMDE